MRILCLNPGPIKDKISKNNLIVKEGRCMERSGAWSNLRMPITLAYISSILKKEGHEVKLIDYIALQYIGKKANIEELLDKFKPEIAILNTSMQTAFGEDMDNAMLIKEKLPNTKILFIGIAPTIISEQIVKEGYVDIAIRGEPEGIIAKLVSKINSGDNLRNFKGITFIDKGDIIKNPNNDTYINLDNLPYPDYESLPLEAYKIPIENKKQVLIESSRGCPYRCIYCNAKNYYGLEFRSRDPKKVVDEIEYVMKLGVERVLFWADTFTLDKKFVFKLCDLMINRGINKKIKWVVNSRVDTVSLEMLKKMKEAGCFLVVFGVESGNQEILDYAKKDITLQDSINAFKWAKKAKILTAAHVVFGLAPFETDKTILKTIKFVNALKPNYANFHIVVPYAGTKIYDDYNKEGYIINKDYRYFETTHANISLPTISNKELEYWRNRAFFKFFFKPRIIIQELAKVKNIKEFISLIDNGFWFFSGWIIVGKDKY